MKKRTVLILALALVVIVAAVLLLWLRPSSAPKTVAINETNFPDENFRTVVNQYDGDRDGVLSSAELSDVTWINCADHGITSLKGIEYFFRSDRAGLLRKPTVFPGREPEHKADQAGVLRQSVDRAGCEQEYGLGAVVLL